jgi:putative glutamine amidotransferase
MSDVKYCNYSSVVISVREILNAPELIVNTHHRQAVAEVGAGLKATAFSPDGVIEAIESDDRRLIGVQFHPERMFEKTQALFVDFVARCRRE